MFLIFHNIIIGIYGLMIHLAAPFNKKASRWIAGRKNWSRKLSKSLPDNRKIIWMHVASLGEYEQGRPVLEVLRECYPDHFILLTFFSPSGYDHVKKIPHADLKFYLPLDTRYNAALFCGIVNPDVAIFVKYEFWFNILNELNKRKKKVFFISAIFRSNQYFFKWYGRYALEILSKSEMIHLQNKASYDLLEKAGLRNIAISGDTRFDRVSQIANTTDGLPEIAAWIANRKCLIAGSTWPVDDEILLRWFSKQSDDSCMLVAQHQINENAFEKLLSKFPDLRFDKFNNLPLQSGQQPSGILLINSIGYLSRIYRYATAVYIGGGFGKGIHNTLEAAVYGNPIIIGPRYQKFQEAVDLVKLNGIIAVDNEQSLHNALDLLMNDDKMNAEKGNICGKFVEENTGATVKIAEDIEEALDKLP